MNFYLSLESVWKGNRAVLFQKNFNYALKYKLRNRKFVPKIENLLNEAIEQLNILMKEY